MSEAIEPGSLPSTGWTVFVYKPGTAGGSGNHRETLENCTLDYVPPKWSIGATSTDPDSIFALEESLEAGDRVYPVHLYHRKTEFRCHGNAILGFGSDGPGFVRGTLLGQGPLMEGTLQGS